MKAILDVATALAAPFDLTTMLAEVIGAAKQVLDADRGSVWLYDAAADELVLEIATDMRTVRIPAGTGLVGTCARNRRIISVPDCYADPRFDPAVDRESGYRTRCMLTLPLVDHNGVLVGVMQVLNKRGSPFDAKDEAMATALAAGAARGDRTNPVVNFYFGGFGNNYVDDGPIKRYREHYSLPGLPLERDRRAQLRARAGGMECPPRSCSSRSARRGST